MSAATISTVHCASRNSNGLTDSPSAVNSSAPAAACSHPSDNSACQATFSFPILMHPSAASDLTDSPSAVKSTLAIASGLTHSPLTVKSDPGVDYRLTSSIIADLTRPLWPPPVPELPTPEPPDFSNFPELQAKRNLEELQKDVWARRLEEGVRHSSPEEAERATFPQVKSVGADDALCRTKIRGRTKVDDARKRAMLTLLGIGCSLRMTAAYVGVSHQTVANVLAGDPAFSEDVRQARERAKVFPLNCILRECGRSWKAATWLLEYMERSQSAERSDADKHVERVRAQALALIEKDLAKKMRKTAAKEGYQPWLPAEEKENAQP
jgi:hypothetical protein